MYSASIHYILYIGNDLNRKNLNKSVDSSQYTCLCNERPLIFSPRKGFHHILHGMSNPKFLVMLAYKSFFFNILW